MALVLWESVHRSEPDSCQSLSELHHNLLLHRNEPKYARDLVIGGGGGGGDAFALAVAGILSHPKAIPQRRAYAAEILVEVMKVVPSVAESVLNPDGEMLKVLTKVLGTSSSSSSSSTPKKILSPVGIRGGGGAGGSSSSSSFFWGSPHSSHGFDDDLSILKRRAGAARAISDLALYVDGFAKAAVSSAGVSSSSNSVTLSQQLALLLFDGDEEGKMHAARAIANISNSVPEFADLVIAANFVCFLGEDSSVAAAQHSGHPHASFPLPSPSGGENATPLPAVRRVKKMSVADALSALLRDGGSDAKAEAALCISVLGHLNTAFCSDLVNLDPLGLSESILELLLSKKEQVEHCVSAACVVAVILDRISVFGEIVWDVWGEVGMQRAAKRLSLLFRTKKNEIRMIKAARAISALIVSCPYFADIVAHVDAEKGLFAKHLAWAMVCSRKSAVMSAGSKRALKLYLVRILAKIAFVHPGFAAAVTSAGEDLFKGSQSTMFASPIPPFLDLSSHEGPSSSSSSSTIGGAIPLVLMRMVIVCVRKGGNGGELMMLVAEAITALAMHIEGFASVITSISLQSVVGRGDSLSLRPIFKAQMQDSSSSVSPAAAAAIAAAVDAVTASATVAGVNIVVSRSTLTAAAAATVSSSSSSTLPPPATSTPSNNNPPPSPLPATSSSSSSIPHSPFIGGPNEEDWLSLADALPLLLSRCETQLEAETIALTLAVLASKDPNFAADLSRASYWRVAGGQLVWGLIDRTEFLSKLTVTNIDLRSIHLGPEAVAPLADILQLCATSLTRLSLSGVTFTSPSKADFGCSWTDRTNSSNSTEGLSSPQTTNTPCSPPPPSSSFSSSLLGGGGTSQPDYWRFLEQALTPFSRSSSLAFETGNNSGSSTPYHHHYQQQQQQQQQPPSTPRVNILAAATSLLLSSPTPAPALPPPPPLSTLCLAGCKLGAEGAVWLSSAVACGWNKSLTKLDLCENVLASGGLLALSSMLKSCSLLLDLSLANNGIDKLPASEPIFPTTLQRLNLSGNSFVALPATLLECRDLQVLSLADCPRLRVPSPEIVAEGTTEKILRELQEWNKLTDWRRCKLFFFGNARCGKSSLLKAIQKEKFDERLPSTIGIQVSREMQKKWAAGGMFSRSSASTTTTNADITAFDFGGQREQRIMHEFFLCGSQTVYLVAFDMTEGVAAWRSSIAYWLDLLESQLTRLSSRQKQQSKKGQQQQQQQRRNHNSSNLHDPSSAREGVRRSSASAAAAADTEFASSFSTARSGLGSKGWRVLLVGTKKDLVPLEFLQAMNPSVELKWCHRRFPKIKIADCIFTSAKSTDDMKHLRTVVQQTVERVITAKDDFNFLYKVPECFLGIANNLQHCTSSSGMLLTTMMTIEDGQLLVQASQPRSARSTRSRSAGDAVTGTNIAAVGAQLAATTPTTTATANATTSASPSSTGGAISMLAASSNATSTSSITIPVVTKDEAAHFLTAVKGVCDVLQFETGIRFLNSVREIIVHDWASKPFICYQPDWLARVIAAFVGSKSEVKTGGIITFKQAEQLLQAANAGGKTRQDILQTLAVLSEFGVCFPLDSDRYIFPSISHDSNASWVVMESEHTVGRRLVCHFGHKITAGIFCRLQVHLCHVQVRLNRAFSSSANPSPRKNSNTNENAGGDASKLSATTTTTIEFSSKVEFDEKRIFKHGITIFLPDLSSSVLVRLHDDCRAVDIVARGPVDRVHEALEFVQTEVSIVLIEAERVAASWAFLCPICVQSKSYAQRPLASQLWEGEELPCESCEQLHDVTVADFLHGRAFERNPFERDKYPPWMPLYSNENNDDFRLRGRRRSSNNSESEWSSNNNNSIWRRMSASGLIIDKDDNRVSFVAADGPAALLGGVLQGDRVLKILNGTSLEDAEATGKVVLLLERQVTTDDDESVRKRKIWSHESAQFLKALGVGANTNNNNIVGAASVETTATASIISTPVVRATDFPSTPSGGIMLLDSASASGGISRFPSAARGGGGGGVGGGMGFARSSTRMDSAAVAAALKMGGSTGTGLGGNSSFRLPKSSPAVTINRTGSCPPPPVGDSDDRSNMVSTPVCNNNNSSTLAGLLRASSNVGLQKGEVVLAAATAESVIARSLAHSQQQQQQHLRQLEATSSEENPLQISTHPEEKSPPLSLMACSSPPGVFPSPSGGGSDLSNPEEMWSAAAAALGISITPKNSNSSNNSNNLLQQGESSTTAAMATGGDGENPIVDPADSSSTSTIVFEVVIPLTLMIGDEVKTKRADGKGIETFRVSQMFARSTLNGGGSSSNTAFWNSTEAGYRQVIYTPISTGFDGLKGQIIPPPPAAPEKTGGDAKSSSSSAPLPSPNTAPPTTTSSTLPPASSPRSRGTSLPNNNNVAHLGVVVFLESTTPSTSTIPVALTFHKDLQLSVLTRDRCLASNDPRLRLWWGEAMRAWNSMLGTSRCSATIDSVIAVRNPVLEAKVCHQWELFGAMAMMNSEGGVRAPNRLSFLGGGGGAGAILGGASGNTGGGAAASTQATTPVMLGAVGGGGGGDGSGGGGLFSASTSSLLSSSTGGGGGGNQSNMFTSAAKYLSNSLGLSTEGKVRVDHDLHQRWVMMRYEENFLNRYRSPGTNEICVVNGWCEGNEASHLDIAENGFTALPFASTMPTAQFRHLPVYHQHSITNASHYGGNSIGSDSAGCFGRGFALLQNRAFLNVYSEKAESSRVVGADNPNSQLLLLPPLKSTLMLSWVVPGQVFPVTHPIHQQHQHHHNPQHQQPVRRSSFLSGLGGGGGSGSLSSSSSNPASSVDACLGEPTSFSFTAATSCSRDSRKWLCYCSLKGAPTHSGKVCDPDSQCRSRCIQFQNYDSYYSVIKRGEAAYPPPESNPPYHDELVVFRSEQLLPGFVMNFSQRPKNLLWLDARPNASEFAQIEAESWLSPHSGVKVEWARNLLSAVEWLLENSVCCPTQQQEQQHHHLLQHQRQHHQLLDAPADHFRIISSGSLCQQLLGWFNGDPAVLKSLELAWVKREISQNQKRRRRRRSSLEEGAADDGKTDAQLQQSNSTAIDEGTLALALDLIPSSLSFAPQAWKFRYPPILIYHSGKPESIATVRLAIAQSNRLNISESADFEVAVSFGKMEEDW